MTDAAAASEAVFVGLESMCFATGRFAAVNRHEVKNAPTPHLAAEIFANRIEPNPLMSGLAVTSLMVTYTVRIGKGMLTKPEDQIDPAVIAATMDLMTRLYSDLDFGVAGVELGPLMPEGGGLAGQSGYLNRDGKLYRVMDLNIPVIFTDCFPQVR